MRLVGNTLHMHANLLPPTHVQFVTVCARLSQTYAQSLSRLHLQREREYALFVVVAN